MNWEKLHDSHREQTTAWAALQTIKPGWRVARGNWEFFSILVMKSSLAHASRQFDQ
jgi:hypothetical protein